MESKVAIYVQIVHVNGFSIHVPDFESRVLLLVRLTPGEAEALVTLTNQMRDEIQARTDPDQDALISYLKIFLINASRIKLDQQKEAVGNQAASPLAIALREGIESHFRTIHGAAGYAGLLNSTTPTLNRLSKLHFGKTLTDLIADRLIIEAKRELYLTAKPVREIASELDTTTSLLQPVLPETDRGLAADLPQYDWALLRQSGWLVRSPLPGHNRAAVLELRASFN